MALPKNKKLPKRPRSDFNDPDKDKGPGKGPGKGGKKKGMPRYYGGLGKYKGVDTRVVRRLVNGVLRDERQDLKSQRRQARRMYRNENNRINKDYQRGLGDLQHIFGESRDYLNHLQGQSQQMYQDQSAKAQAASQALQQALGGTYSGAASGAMNELARLGIQGGGSFAQMQNDAANQQAMALQGGANTQGTMDLAAGNSAQLGNLLQGMNQGSYMSHIGRNLNARNDAKAENRQNWQDNRNLVQEAISDANGGRSDLFFQLLQQLQQTGWNQFLQKKG